ncbi:DUF1707 domain-containing protein [Streptomyces sp. NPDC019539]|uniref:DUF1707 SHOCT-like domain-containing protein n=1 Tax=Streptomyces sp. NPDC019539 TaxID=3365063 RepID=UPI0037BA1B70
MTSLPEDPTRLIREDDRDRAVQRLQDAYAQGHLSHEELDERLHRLLTARTHGELLSALAPLPQEDAATPSTIAVAGGRIRRRGAWRVPRFLKVESAYGRVHLDLSRAVIEHPVIDIELHLGTGKAKITVPRDAIVDAEEVRTVSATRGGSRGVRTPWSRRSGSSARRGGCAAGSCRACPSTRRVRHHVPGHRRNHRFT